jgi:hypothetical protein
MRSTNSTALYRPDLGIAVQEYVEGPEMGLIGLQILPIFPVPEVAGTFPVIPSEALLKLPDTSRSPRGNYNRGDWKYEEGKYNAGSEHGWEEPIDDSERKMLDVRVPGLADYVATKRATNHILKSQEKRISDKVFNAVSFTPHPVAIEWDKAATAVPLTNIKAAKLAFRKQCGMLPDAIVMNYEVFERIKEVQQIIDRLKYTYPGMDIDNMGAAELARLFRIPRVLIGGAVYDSAGKNVTSVITDIWDDEYCALIKIPQDRQDVTSPGLGWTFLWSEDSPQNPVVEQYREDKIRSDVMRVRHNTDEYLLKSVNEAGATVSDIAAACMYLMSNITT